MTQATKPRHSRQARLSVAWETAAECQLQLTPFPGCPDGWAGSISQFLAHIRDGTFLLECVPLVPVIDQYVTHIKGLSLDRAGEFLDLAASLIHWKSRLILPVDPLLTGADGDPREEIMRDLREGEQRRRGRRTAPASKTEQNHATEGAAELSLLDLFILLNDVEQALLTNPSYQVSASSVTVADQLQWLTQWFADDGSDGDSADSLFLLHPSSQARLCLFLALLEMVKSGQLSLDQTEAFGSIAIRPIKVQTPVQLTDQ
jgi:segregation and condensation protein A